MGRVQLVVFRSAYFFRIARQKSCDYWLITCMKNHQHEGSQARNLPRLSFQMLRKTPRKFCLAPSVNTFVIAVFRSTRLPVTLLFSYLCSIECFFLFFFFFLVLAFSFKLWIKSLLLSPLSAMISFRCAFAAFVSINFILTFCTQFQLSLSFHAY